MGSCSLLSLSFVLCEMGMTIIPTYSACLCEVVFWCSYQVLCVVRGTYRKCRAKGISAGMIFRPQGAGPDSLNCLA